jgi:CubicO group peptidase (beta-lactamase class C family)
MVFPADEWIEAVPEDVWIDSVGLDTAVDDLQRNSLPQGPGVDEMLLVRSGRVIWRGSQVNHVHMVHSVSKSFATTALGLMVDLGAVTLDTLATDFVPELAEHYPQMTLRHMVTHTSGYLPKGYDYGQTDPASNPLVPAPPLFTPPGSQYAYDQPPMTQMMHVLARAAGEPIQDVFQRQIGDPIGLYPENWNWDHVVASDGTVVEEGGGYPGGVHISASDLARFGHLILNDGNWDGQQLISQEWLAEATRVQVPDSVPTFELNGFGPGYYGLGWWVFDRSVEAWGAENNYLYVLPSLDMVAVRMGNEAGVHSLNAFKPVWDAFISRLDNLVLPAFWDGAGDGVWRDIDPATGRTRWQTESGRAALIPPTGIAEIHQNCVTIEHRERIGRLDIDGGALSIKPHGHLSSESFYVKPEGAVTVAGRLEAKLASLSGAMHVLGGAALDTVRGTVGQSGNLRLDGFGKVESLSLRGGELIIGAGGLMHLERFAQTSGNAVLSGALDVKNFRVSAGDFTVTDGGGPMRVSDRFSISELANWRFLLSDSDWDSPIVIDDSAATTLRGNLVLATDPILDLDRLLGSSLQLFDWTAPSDPADQFPSIVLPPGTRWDLSRLYTEGAVALTQILSQPEVPGDFNENGLMDVADVDLLIGQTIAGSTRSYFDLNGDRRVDPSDLKMWIEDLSHTWYGDANLDGEFDTGDLVQVSGAGKYETSEYASWSEGDWNGDGVFDTGDIVIALEDGGYEKGPRTEAAAVPEPGAWVLCLVAMTLLFVRRR